MVQPTPAAAASSNTTRSLAHGTGSREEAFERLRRLTHVLTADHAGFLMEEGSERGASQCNLPASSAEAAIGVSKAHGGQIDLLLTDVVMPGMNGPTLAKELSESRPSMRVLYTSGFTDSAVAEHGVAVEETAFLAKPFSSAALTAKVLAVLDPA
jgi:CheY-like chemotaxis protein